MLALALTASLLCGQADVPPPMPLPEAVPQAPAEPMAVTVPEGPSVPLRVGVSTGAGTLGGGAALGIVALLSLGHPAFDSTFTTAALVAVMTSGVGFAIHTLLGGRGEVILGFLAAIPWVLGITGILYATQVDVNMRPILVGAISALPAAASAVVVLELSQPRMKKLPVQLQVSPAGVSGTF